MHAKIVKDAGLMYCHGNTDKEREEWSLIVNSLAAAVQGQVSQVLGSRAGQVQYVGGFYVLA